MRTGSPRQRLADFGVLTNFALAERHRVGNPNLNRNAGIQMALHHSF